MNINFHALLIPFVFAMISVTLWSCDKDDDVDTPLTDVDGNEYTQGTIGSQVWMGENLKVTHYRNGDAILSLDRSHWDSNTTAGAYANYDDLASNGNTYGRLYNWLAVTDPRGLAPDGWHVATEADWNELSQFLGGDTIAGGKLKEVGFTHWMSPNTGATDEVGFTGLPGGERLMSNTDDDGLGRYGFFWTTNQAPLPTSAIYRALSFNTDNITGTTGFANMASGFSVRCVKD